jgi:dienelactone hydrolase
VRFSSDISKLISGPRPTRASSPDSLSPARLGKLFPFSPVNDADITRIQCPVHGVYGGNDARVTATVAQSENLMKKAGKTFEHVTYEGAGHGFMRAGEAPDAGKANKKAHDRAWARWKELLKRL